MIYHLNLPDSIYTGHHSMQEIDRLIFVWGMDTVVKSPAGPCRIDVEGCPWQNQIYNDWCGKRIFYQLCYFSFTPTQHHPHFQFKVCALWSTDRLWCSLLDSKEEKVGSQVQKKDKFFSLTIILEMLRPRLKALATACLPANISTAWRFLAWLLQHVK